MKREDGQDEHQDFPPYFLLATYNQDLSSPKPFHPIFFNVCYCHFQATIWEV